MGLARLCPGGYHGAKGTGRAAMAKIRRELARVMERLRDALAILPERRTQRRSDRQFPAGLAQTPGALPETRKVAIFVIWQPDGLARSTLLTCCHLAERGYATMAVSNAPLSAPDRAALAAQVWRVVERPNHGHDFGAWRDGIRLLRDRPIRPERVLLLNDSIWFPLLPEDRLLDRLDADSGFVGAVWSERPGRPHSAHFQSYLLGFGPQALADPAFARFWDRYLASSRRASVLRRGEKGLSRAMVAAGLAAQPVISPARLLAHAEAAAPDELARILDYAALTDPVRAALRERLLGQRQDAGFRSAALALISSTLMSGPFLETHPYLAARAFGLHLLKKRREPVSAEGRRQVLRAVAAGDLPAPQPAVLDEIRARDA